VFLVFPGFRLSRALARSAGMTAKFRANFGDTTLVVAIRLFASAPATAPFKL